MKAVVLAAGEGKRLEPLTALRPKPMIPLANRPLLEYVIQAIVNAGLDEIVLVVGYKRDRIQSYFGSGDEWGVDIEYAVQEKQLGTGDAVLQASDHIEGDFLVLNGDRVIDESIIERVISEKEGQNESVMAVTHVDEPSLYGVVELDENSHVTTVNEKPEPYEVSSDLINAGIYAFGSEIFQAIRDTTSLGELALTDVLKDNLEDIPVRAIPYGKRWLDVTRPWDLISVNEKLTARSTGPTPEGVSIDESAVVSENVVLGKDSRIYGNASVLRGSAIGPNVSIGPNSTVQNSIILSDTTIQAGTVVKDAVISENVTLGPHSTVPGGPADVILQDEVYRGVTFGGIVGDNTTVESSATIVPGSFVGNGSTIDHDARVEGRIDPQSTVRRG